MSWVYRRPFDYRPSAKLGSGLFVLAFAAGAMTGTAALNFGESTTLSGTGALAANESLTIDGSAIPSNDDPNAAEGSAALLFGQNATLAGAGALLASDSWLLGASATASGTNAYQPHMWAKRRRRDDIPFDYYRWDSSRVTIFPYSVSTATAGIGSVAIGADAILRGTGRLAGVGANVLDATGTMVAGGGLAGSSSSTFGVGTAALTSGASGFITGDAGWSFSVNGTITGAGALYGPAPMTLDAEATYVILVPPSGNAAMDFGATGVIRNVSEGAGIVDAMAFSSTDDLQMFFSA